MKHGAQNFAYLFFSRFGWIRAKNGSSATNYIQYVPPRSVPSLSPFVSVIQSASPSVCLPACLSVRMCACLSLVSCVCVRASACVCVRMRVRVRVRVRVFSIRFSAPLGRRSP